MRNLLAKHWVAGAAFLSLGLCALVPMAAAQGTAVLLIYLHMPVYMIHQIEEHAGDRFRTFVNQRVFGGVEALTVDDVLWINLPGVWGVNLLAFYAAWFMEPGFGLTAPYLMAVNALGHLGMAARLKRYNPGLGSALGLFLPLALTTLALIPATLQQHALGLGVSLAIHAAIALRANSRSAHAARAPGGA